MRKTNKKGFTIVELVIVIAVIAILAAVMIPTFGNVTKNAQNSARDQIAKNHFTNYLVYTNATPVSTDKIVVEYEGKTYVYSIENGNINLDSENPDGDTIADDACVYTDAEDGFKIFYGNHAYDNCADVECNNACDAENRTAGTCDTNGTNGACSVCGATNSN